MRTELAMLAWPSERLGEALSQLAERAGYPLPDSPLPPPVNAIDGERAELWIEAAARWLALEAEPVEAPEGDLETLVSSAPPALVMTTAGALLLVGARGSRVLVLGPDRRVHRVAAEDLRDTLLGPVDPAVAAEITASLEGLSLTPSQHAAAHRALVHERRRGKPVGGCTLLRLPANASFRTQIVAEGLLPRGALLLAAHGAQLALGVAGWAMLGRGALDGHLERVWLVAWAMLLVTMIPLRLLALWLQGALATRFGKILKRRLLAGSLRLDGEMVRREGAGQLLARTLETGTIESMALNAGIGALLALVELVVVLVVLGVGSGGPGHALLLVGWIAVAAAVGVQAYRRSVRWANSRRALTHDLVERMIGHRTRLAQQIPAAWHQGEDEAVERYLGLSKRMDRSDLLLQILPYAWVVVGVLGLAPSVVSRDATAGLAISLGGVLLAGAAMARLSAGVMQATGALVGWREVAPLFEAASGPETHASPSVVLAPPPETRAAAPLLGASNIGFAYPGRPEPVLVDASLRIDVGDRVLLEGPSGGGKSTLASILAGLRRPTSGLLLLDGLDRPTLGDDGWRQRVAAAPQYHDNHILTETLAFNLLMGRRWPPRREDLLEALAVCRELGLGDLLDRMPAGLFQTVGETGWRLSQGERSRVFMARALLQRARLVVLDETFAALDPHTLDQCLRYVIQRAPSLVVIAHP